MTPSAQHTNVRIVAAVLADLARTHQIIVGRMAMGRRWACWPCKGLPMTRINPSPWTFWGRKPKG
jgi:hypothetical protein